MLENGTLMPATFTHSHTHTLTFTGKHSNRHYWQEGDWYITDMCTSNPVYLMSLFPICADTSGSQQINPVFHPRPDHSDPPPTPFFKFRCRLSRSLYRLKWCSEVFGLNGPFWGRTSNKGVRDISQNAFWICGYGDHSEKFTTTIVLV